MAWQHRLPDGMRHEGSSSQGFTLSVSLPVGEDGFAPLQCPADADHRFKATLTPGPRRSVRLSGWCGTARFERCPDGNRRRGQAGQEPDRDRRNDGADRDGEDEFGRGGAGLASDQAKK